jgi:hypothetical protein
VGLAFAWLGRPARRLGTPDPDGPLGGWRYVAAAAVGLAGFLYVVGYIAYNIRVHGEPPWHTSLYTQLAIDNAFSQPARLREALLYKTPFFLLFLLPFAFLLWPEFRAGARRARDEPVSALWLSIGLVYLIGLIMASVYWVQENSTIFWFDNHRYVVIAVVPIAWLVARHADFGLPSFKWRAAGTFLVLAGLTATVAFAPIRHMEDHAAMALEGHLEPGMSLAFEGAVNKYAVYAYMPTHDVEVFIVWRGEHDEVYGGDPDFIITKTRDEDWAQIRYRDYIEVGSWSQDYYNGESLVAKLWAKPEHAGRFADA